MIMSIGDLVKAVTEAPANIRAKIQHVLTEEPDIAPDTDWRTCTKTEAGKRLGVSRQVIYRMVRAGKLEMRAVGGTNRVLLSSIDNYMRNNVQIASTHKYYPRKTVTQHTSSVLEK